MNKMDISKITAEVIADLAKTTASALYNRLIKVLGDIKNKKDIDFGTAYANYLDCSKTTHEKIKTLLYRHTAKDIYSFYQCVGLKRDGCELDTSDINNVLQVGHRLIVTGTAGIGKSLMMKHFLLNTIQNTSLVPVLVELRGLNDYDKNNVDLQGYIHSVMEKLHFKMERKYFDYSLEMGCYVILLDGFDEVKSDIAKGVASQILTLSEKYSENYFIVSSRPLDDEFVGWNQFEEVCSMALSKDQALSLIAKIEYDQHIKDGFYRELNDNLYDKYRTFASNPLLLTIMLMTFANRMSIPHKLNDFYEQAFGTLFHKHDATKRGYKRDIRSKLGYEDFRTVFSYFCFKSFFKDNYEFTEHQALEYIGEGSKKKITQSKYCPINYLRDLTNSVCMLVQDGLFYRFSHRSFQEYFAALYTTQLNDLTQKQFLKLWLQGSNFRRTSNYLDMLYELQPGRFINNIIVPEIKELQRLYKDNGSSDEWLIQFLYEDSVIRRSRFNSVYVWRRFLRKTHYLDLIEMTCRIGDYYKNGEGDGAWKNRRNSALYKIINEQYETYNSVSVHSLIRDGYICEVLDFFCSTLERFKYAVEYIESIDSISLSQTNNFSSLLEKL